MMIDAVIIDLDPHFSYLNKGQLVYLQKTLADSNPVYEGSDIGGDFNYDGFTITGATQIVNREYSFTYPMPTSAYSPEQQVVNAYLLHTIFNKIIDVDAQIKNSFAERHYDTHRTRKEFLQSQFETTSKETGITLSEYQRNNFDQAVNDILPCYLFETLFPNEKYDSFAGFNRNGSRYASGY